MKEILLEEDFLKHPKRDDTWEMSNWDIEDKIKEHRKEIYRLKNSRKKQPKLLIFRKENYGDGPMRAHIFEGIEIREQENKNPIIATNHWHPIREKEARQVMEKYEFTADAIKIINETLNKKR